MLPDCQMPDDHLHITGLSLDLWLFLDEREVVKVIFTMGGYILYILWEAYSVCLAIHSVTMEKGEFGC